MTKRDPRRDQTKSESAESRIPHFRNVDEEAQFWDTHSTTEFENEFEPAPDVKFVLRRALSNKAITVRVDERTLADLTAQAARQGIGPSTLVRIWIIERLRAG